MRDSLDATSVLWYAGVDVTPGGVEEGGNGS